MFILFAIKCLSFVKIFFFCELKIDLVNFKVLPSVETSRVKQNEKILWLLFILSENS